MPIFQKKITPPSGGTSAPQKSPAKAAQVQVPSGTGGRRSLTMVGKALAEVVNSRKAASSTSPPKQVLRALPKIKEGENSDATTYDSSTAVESSSNSALITGKPIALERSSSRASKISTPKRATSTVPLVSPSVSSSRKGSPSLQFRKLPAPDSSPTSTLSRVNTSGPQSALPRRLGHVASPSTISIPSASGPANSPESSSTSGASRSTSRGPTSSPTLTRKTRHSPALSVSSIATIPGTTSLKPKLASALPQPKPRPRSAIFTGIPPPLAPLKLANPVVSAKKRGVKEENDTEDQSAGGSKPEKSTGPPSTTGKAAPTTISGKRNPSPTPSMKILADRPLSPLPKRGLRRVVTPVDQVSTSSQDGDGGIKSTNVSPSPFTAPPSTRQIVPPTVRTTSLPRPSTSGSLKPRAPSRGEENKSLTIRGATPAHEQVPERVPTPEEHPNTTKRRKSEAIVSLSAGNGRLRPSASRLSVPSSMRSRPSDPPPTLLEVPSTPSTSKPSKVPDQTFSIPRSRMISFTFADMAMPAMLTAPDDDDTSLSLEISKVDYEEGPSPSQTLSPLPTIFLPPTQPFQQSTSTPSRHHGKTKKKRPSLRPLNASSNERQSILSWDTIVERSREYQEDDAELNGMLADVPAPFTPDARRPSPSVSSRISESSLSLGGLTIDSISGPPSPLDSSFANHVGRSGGAPSSIAQMLFPPSISASPPSGSNNGLETPTDAPDTRALEAEILELRLRIVANESAAEAQTSRVTSLESELATIHSITRARDLSHKDLMRTLGIKAANGWINAAVKEWDKVFCVAQGEMDAIAAERLALEVISTSLSELAPAF